MPGAAGCRWWLAKTTSACDTAAMAVFSRPLRRRRPMQIAVAVLGLAWLAVLGAFVYAAVTVKPSVGGIVSAGGAPPDPGARLFYCLGDSGREVQAAPNPPPKKPLFSFPPGG